MVHYVVINTCDSTGGQVFSIVSLDNGMVPRTAVLGFSDKEATEKALSLLVESLVNKKDQLKLDVSTLQKVATGAHCIGVLDETPIHEVEHASIPK